jgi:peptidoglycan/LPS O-acetylase OafA/YrhL
MAAKINSLEAGRAVAALSVVVFHANGVRILLNLPNYLWLSIFIHGVDFFFVISGYIIFQVHRPDIGVPAAMRPFAIKRFIRLFPILWLVAGVWMVAQHVTHHAVPPGGVAPSLIPYPSLIKPMPDVIWTLRHELLFYIAFLVLIANRRAGVVLFGGWTAAVLVQLMLVLFGRPVTGLASFFMSSFDLDFLFGVGVAYLAPQNRPGVAPLLAGLALVSAALAAGQVGMFYRTGLMDYTTVAAEWWVVVLGACFAVLLYGIIAVEPLVRTPNWLVALGGSSYALYLIHVPIQNSMSHVSTRLPSLVGAVLMIAIPVLAGLALHVWFEKPVSRLLRSLLLAR